MPSILTRLLESTNAIHPDRLKRMCAPNPGEDQNSKVDLQGGSSGIRRPCGICGTAALQWVCLCPDGSISKSGKFRFGHVATTDLSQPFDGLTILIIEVGPWSIINIIRDGRKRLEEGQVKCTSTRSFALQKDDHLTSLSLTLTFRSPISIMSPKLSPASRHPLLLAPSTACRRPHYQYTESSRSSAHFLNRFCPQQRNHGPPARAELAARPPSIWWTSNIFRMPSKHIPRSIRILSN